MRKRIYLIAPLLFLILFAFYYSSYRKEADAIAKAKEEQQAIISRQEALDRKAYQEKINKEAREAAEAKIKAANEKQAIIDAEEKEYDALNKEQVVVTNDRDAAAQKFYELSAQLRDENDLYERANNRISILADEKKFLDTYIPLYKANRDRLSAFLQKVEDTKKAVEAAQTAAAAAKR
jgi:hypothetical protein